uniref:UF2 component of NDC80 kinetochore complex n=1 Tax=Tetraodon nigroviridis TaxID=99883 RepID=H3CPL0_TETNG
MTEITFPVSSADAIVNFYRTEILTGQEAKHFSKSDLTPVPKPETVQTLYMRVLHILYRFRPECHSMVPLLENIHYPQYHEGATAITSVYIRMLHFLPTCLVYDFSLNDLLAPKKQRTLTILSAIMNFFYFRKQRMELILEKQAKYRADLDRLQAYTKSNLEMEKKIEMLMVIPPEQQAEAKELDSALSELNTIYTQEYQEMKSSLLLQCAKKDSIAEGKAIFAEKTQKLAQVKVDISTLKEDIGKLKSQIVESPEELKSQMEKMRENVKNIKLSIEESDERVVELQNMVQSVTYTEAEIQQMYNLLQDLEISMNNSKQRQKEQLELTAQYERKQKELKNLCAEEGQLKRALAMKLDKESKQNIRRQKRKDMKEQHVQEVLGQCNQIHQKREEMAEIQEITAETQQLKAKIQSLRDVCSKETERAQALYDTLSTSIDELHRRIQ